MKFELSDDQALLRRSTRDFLAAEWPLERSKRVMEHEPRGYDPAGWQRLAAMGYLGLTVPPGAGGQGLGPVELAVVLEEMGRVCLPGPFLDVVLAAALLAAAGSQEALLGDVVEGKTIVTVARDDGPFAGNHTAPARLAGGRVRGTKYFVPFAAASDAPAHPRLEELFGLVFDAYEQLRRQEFSPIWGSMIKQQIKRGRSDFSEADYGYKNFAAFLEAARKAGRIDFTVDRQSGAAVVTSVRRRGEGPPPAPAPPRVPACWRELLSDTICPDILDYLKRGDFQRYKQVIERLGIRK